MLLASLSLSAQKTRPLSHAQKVAASYADSLAQLRARYADYRYMGADTLANPYYAALFASPTLYRGTLRRTLGSIGYRPMANLENNDDATSTHNLLARANRLRNFSDHFLATTYSRQPWLVTNNEYTDDDAKQGLRKDIRTQAKPNLKLADKVVYEKTHDKQIDEPGIDIVVHKPNFWDFNADFALQFMQNYISDNWYKGGESNNSLLTSLTLEANYNNKSGLSFENRLEMRIGFLTSPSDTVHNFKTNSDLIRLTNKLGYKAAKNWYYTFSLITWTQFYRGYHSNSRTVLSDFMSPFECVPSVGMEYKYQSKKNDLKLEVNLSPFAANYKYVGRKSLATRFGVKENHHSNFSYGASINATLKWTVFKNVKWNSRFFLFTDYSSTLAEWENTIDLIINKVLSTKLFLHPRFDDTAKRKEGKSYLQFKEYLSIGINLSF